MKLKKYAKVKMEFYKINKKGSISKEPLFVIYYI